MTASDSPRVSWRKDDAACLAVVVSGRWRIQKPQPEIGGLWEELERLPRGSTVAVAVNAASGWDSSLPLFVRRLQQRCRALGLNSDTAQLPPGLQALLQQAERGGATAALTHRPRDHWLTRLGAYWLDRLGEAQTQVSFVGEVTVALAAYARGRARRRPGEFALVLQQCGPGAVPIVTLISLLVGMILAFVGAVQLRMFGAQLYIADLVGLGMAREMGAMMTAIIMAGRTGAAFAAEIGAMRVNEELDALRTTAICPIQYLVIPRIAALVLAMPLLCIYADVMGIIGGALVTVGMFDIALLEYFNESRVWVDWGDFAVGVGKTLVFAVLVAVAGCMRGMRCGGSSTDVGNAATAAVVTGIVWVVVADAILTLMITALDI